MPTTRRKLTPSGSISDQAATTTRRIRAHRRGTAYPPDCIALVHAVLLVRASAQQRGTVILTVKRYWLREGGLGTDSKRRSHKNSCQPNRYRGQGRLHTFLRLELRLTYDQSPQAPCRLSPQSRSAEDQSWHRAPCQRNSRRASVAQRRTIQTFQFALRESDYEIPKVMRSRILPCDAHRIQRNCQDHHSPL